MFFILSKKNIFSKLFKIDVGLEFCWVVLGQILKISGSLFLVVILTKHLHPEEYGRLALAITVGNFIGQAVMSFNNGVGRFFSFSSDKKCLGGYFQAVKNLMLLAGAVVTLLTITGSFGLSFFGLNNWQSVLLATAFFSYVAGCTSCFDAMQNAARQRSASALHGGAEAWLKNILVLLVVHLLGNTCVSVILSYGLAALCICASQFIWVNRLIKNNATKSGPYAYWEWEKQILSFSWPFCIFGVFTWIQISSDRWSLQMFSSLYDVGQYAVVFQLGYTPISIATGIATTFLAPILYQRFDISDCVEKIQSVRKLTWATTYLAIGCTFCGFLFSMFFHQSIFELFATKPYQEFSFLLPWVVFAGGMFSAGQLLSLQLMTEMRTQSLLKVKVCTAIFGVGANILGAWLFGIFGVIAGINAFSASYLLWMVILSSSRCLGKKPTLRASFI